MRSIGAALLLAMLLPLQVHAQQQTGATASALEEVGQAQQMRPHFTSRLSLNAREALAGSLPGSVDLGLQWRQAFAGQQIDVTAWRRMTPPSGTLALIQQQQQDPVYGARIEMKLAPASKKMFADKFIGMQLDSGARIGVRRSNGNPTVYYRNQF